MVIGGTNINRERSGLSGSRCDLLIAIRATIECVVMRLLILISNMCVMIM
jgi:hypothetical protein